MYVTELNLKHKNHISPPREDEGVRVVVVPDDYVDPVAPAETLLLLEEHGEPLGQVEQLLHGHGLVVPEDVAHDGPVAVLQTLVDVLEEVQVEGAVLGLERMQICSNCMYLYTLQVFQCTVHERM